jgi:hypothetical protein
VKDAKWKMRSEVVGFKAISGDHGGDNLGRYFMGLCDRVGICNQDGSKVSIPHVIMSSQIRLSNVDPHSAFYGNARQRVDERHDLFNA